VKPLFQLGCCFHGMLGILQGYLHIHFRQFRHKMLLCKGNCGIESFGLSKEFWGSLLTWWRCFSGYNNCFLTWWSEAATAAGGRPPSPATAYRPRQTRPENLPRQRRTTHLIEIKYCEDTHPEQQLQAAHAQHGHLRRSIAGDHVLLLFS